MAQADAKHRMSAFYSRIRLCILLFFLGGVAVAVSSVRSYMDEKPLREGAAANGRVIEKNQAKGIVPSYTVAVSYEADDRELARDFAVSADQYHSLKVDAEVKLKYIPGNAEQAQLVDYKRAGLMHWMFTGGIIVLAASVVLLVIVILTRPKLPTQPVA